MNIGFVLMYVFVFCVIAYFINYGKSENTIAKAIFLKSIAYFYLAIALLIGFCTGGDVERYTVGLTLGIAIIEGSIAWKEGLKNINSHK